MSSRSLIRAALAALLVACAFASPGAAQQPPSPGDAAPSGPAETPRDAVLGYLLASREGNYERAARYLDLRNVPRAEREKAGPRLARQLKVVLDQTLWIDWAMLSDSPEGDPADGHPRGVDYVGTIEQAEPAVDVLVARVEGTGGPEWRFHAATVDRIPPLYEQFGYGPLADLLPAPLFDVRFLELQLWQWIGMLGLVLLAWGLAAILSAGIVRALGHAAARTETRIDDLVLGAIAGPLTATLGVALFWIGAFALRLPVPALEQIGRVGQGLIVVTITWLALRLTDVSAHALQSRLARRGDTAAATIVPMGRRIAKVFLIAIAALSALQNLGYNVTGLIAGLGIGGLAVALAAQKTFENFLGGVSVIADRPIQVGQFGRFGDWIGTVEEIGLRSTRVRTLDRTVVTIPNASFSSMEIENFARRDRIRFHAILGVRYETTAEQLRHLLVELKRLLASHARIDPDPARVRFVSFGAYSLDLEVFAYANTGDWDEFLAIREDLMLRIIDTVEASGSGFAFPSSTVYVGRDDGVDRERAGAAEAQVRGWREGGELPLPWLPSARAAELAGTVPFPPEGSAKP
jgi:MscS family membrane protein